MYLIIRIKLLIHKAISNLIISSRFNICHKLIYQWLVRIFRMDLGWKEEAFNIRIISNKFLIIICNLGLIRTYPKVIKILYKILATLWVRNGVMANRRIFSWISNYLLFLETATVIIIHPNFLSSKANSLFINI